MPRAEAGSVKAIGNAIKAKGLTRLRWYCQICQKACRDANGYKCHLETEAHMRQMSAIGSSGGKVVDDFSKQFQDEFITLLSRRFGTRRIRANQVYQEYIQDRHHLHMNATKWVTLTEFVKHLGREGLVVVEENEQGWFISWVDNSPAALQRQDALRKMERAKMDEEGRQRKLLAEQISRAKEIEGEGDNVERAKEEGLKRDEGSAPVKIGISFGASAGKPGASSSASSSSAAAPTPASSSSSTPSAAAPAPFRINPLKAAAKPVLGGAFKKASSSAPSTHASGSGSSKPSNMTAAERIMQEELERKKRRETMGPQPSAKRMRL